VEITIKFQLKVLDGTAAAKFALAVKQAIDGQLLRTEGYDFLKSVDADKVTLRFTDAVTALSLEPNTEGGGTCRCVIMPMRV